MSRIDRRAFNLGLKRASSRGSNDKRGSFEEERYRNDNEKEEQKIRTLPCAMGNRRGREGRGRRQKFAPRHTSRSIIDHAALARRTILAGRQVDQRSNLSLLCVRCFTGCIAIIMLVYAAGTQRTRDNAKHRRRSFGRSGLYCGSRSDMLVTS